MRSVVWVRFREKFGFIFLMMSLTIMLRFFVFKNFYVFSNDDLYYADWLDFLRGANDLKFVDSVQMPPGYPIILWIESVFLHDFYNIKFFELVIILSLLPLICLGFLWKLKIEVDKPYIALIFFIPFTIVGISTINISSEIWFLVFISFGIFMLFEFSETLKWSKLTWASCLFSFSYLIRPEGLLYFASIALIIFLLFRDSSKRERVDWIAISQVFAIPVITVGLFMLYMHTYFGEFVISGKLKINLEFARGISENLAIRVFENSVALLRIFVAPMFLGPLLSILVLVGAFRLFKEKDLSELAMAVAVMPIILIGAVCLYFYPMGRTLIVLCPALLYIGVLGWESLSSSLPKNLKLYANIIFVSILLIQSVYPFSLNKLYDSTRSYYSALDSLREPSNRLIFSREPTLVLQNASYRYCENLDLCSDIPDILLLSNSIRAKLTPITSIESVVEFPQVIYLGDVIYERVSVTSERVEPVYTYMRRNSS